MSIAFFEHLAAAHLGALPILAPRRVTVFETAASVDPVTPVPHPRAPQPVHELPAVARGASNMDDDQAAPPAVQPIARAGSVTPPPVSTPATKTPAPQPEAQGVWQSIPSRVDAETRVPPATPAPAPAPGVTHTSPATMGLTNGWLQPLLARLARLESDNESGAAPAPMVVPRAATPVVLRERMPASQAPATSPVQPLSRVDRAQVRAAFTPALQPVKLPIHEPAPAAAAPAMRVHVSIGRIEIRSAAAGHAQQPSVPGYKPSLGLDDYLRARAGGDV